MLAQNSNKKFIEINLALITIIAIILFNFYFNSPKKRLNGASESNKISSTELKESELEKFRDSISFLLIKIDSLENAVRTLKNRKDSIVYKEKKIIEKVPDYIYIEKQEHYRFGKDKGKIIIYSNKPNGSCEVYIDGDLVGKLKRYYSVGKPDCNSNDPSAEINLIVTAGKHHIEFKNYNSTREFYTEVIESECNFVPLISQ